MIPSYRGAARIRVCASLSVSSQSSGVRGRADISARSPDYVPARDVDVHHQRTGGTLKPAERAKNMPVVRRHALQRGCANRDLLGATAASYDRSPFFIHRFPM
jgi:hypothetical protein